MMTDLVFYPESAKDALLDKLSPVPYPEGYTERLSGAFTWTEMGAGGVESFIVNTMLNRRTYHKPKLVSISGNRFVISVLEDDSPSGTMRAIKLIYILILPRNTL